MLYIYDLYAREHLCNYLNWNNSSSFSCDLILFCNYVQTANIMLSRTCVAIEIKWKKAGVFNRDLRLLQFLIVIEWITSKHFDVILPHPIKDVYVETADPARYNDCRYVRSRWHVYTYTVGSLEFVISLSLQFAPRSSLFPFCLCSVVRLLSVSSYTFTKSQLGFSFFSLSRVAGSLLSLLRNFWFSFFVDIYLSV